MNKRITLIFAALFLLLNISKAQVSITSSVTSYSENFNTLPTTGTSTTNPNPANWVRYAKTTSATTMGVTAGTATSGGFYSAGAASDTDRAFGILLSANAKPLYAGVKFVNNTGSTIVSAAVSYRCEQWRRGNTTAGQKDTLLFDYTYVTDSIHLGTWTNVPALTGSSTNSSTTASALDGNTIFQNISGNITGLVIPNGGTFWIRFNDFDIPGSEDLLAVDNFNIAFTTGTVAACAEPTNSVTNIVLNATSTTAVAGSFSATSPVSDGYLVLLDSNATVPTIVDATTYTIGQTIGTATVISNSSSTTFSKSGLVSNTIYHAYVFPYNNSGCTGGPNYKTTLPGNDTTKTLLDVCPEPTAKPTNLQFTLVDNTHINGKFNKAVPAPTGGYVVVYSTSSNVAYPDDTTTYTVNDSISYSSYKSKVAYVGTDSNFAISGLTAGTKYYFAVVPFNTCGYGPNYFRTAPLRDDTITSGTAPFVDCVQPSGVSNTSIVKLDSTNTSITIKWIKPANADSVVVIAGPNATIGFVTVRDSAFYGVGTTIPGSNGIVYYRGADSTVKLTGLTANTVYKIIIASFNNRNCTNGPNYSGLATSTIKTAAGVAGECTQPSGVSNTSIVKLDSTASTIQFKFTIPVSADSVMVLAGPNATIGFVSVRDSVYYPVNSTIPGSQAKVYARGTDSVITLTGLTPNTVYKILVVAFNNKACTFGPNYAGIATSTIKTGLTTGVKYNQTEAAFSIYPNPTNNGMLFVKFNKALKDDAVIEVIDVLGRKLSALKITNGVDEKMIDVSNFAKGTYILNVIYKDTNNVSSFIVE